MPRSEEADRLLQMGNDVEWVVRSTGLTTEQVTERQRVLRNLGLLTE